MAIHSVVLLRIPYLVAVTGNKMAPKIYIRGNRVFNPESCTEPNFLGCFAALEGEP